MAILIVLCLLLFSGFIIPGTISMIINFIQYLISRIVKFIQYLRQQTISSLFIKTLNALWFCVPVLIYLMLVVSYVKISSGYTFLLTQDNTITNPIITNPINVIREILTENSSVKSLINNLILKTIIIVLIFYRFNLSVRKNQTKVVFILVSLCFYLSMPFDLVYDYRIAPEIAKQEQKAKQEEARREVEEAKREAEEIFFKTNLQPLYDRLYNTGKGESSLGLPTKQGCIDKVYQEGTITCGEAAFVCNNLSRLKDTKDIRYNCRKNGW
ncbi:hypothetical protein [Dolichospermum circinale]|uniref:hypothetical protein n=1 Tax=Dolichospermum circinale TaxID=109265 RepID=UPI00232D65F9|nr:hypothetical protein [Dolichospermum circinale]MDB9448925.1 hypothetical protein [Dolichospermum circinale CS-547]